MKEKNKQLSEEELTDELYERYIKKYENKENEEEIVEAINEVEEIMVEESEFTDFEIDTFLHDLKDEFLLNNLKTNDKVNLLASKIAKNSKEYLDYNTYMWVMYAFAMKYKELNLFDPMKFCFIRMRSVLDKMNGIGEFPKALTKVDSTLTNEMNNAILENTMFITDEKKGVIKKSIEMEIAMFFIMIFMMSFVFKISLVTSILVSLAMVYVTYKFTKFSLEKAFMDTLLVSLNTDGLEDIIVKFDLPVKNS